MLRLNAYRHRQQAPCRAVNWETQKAKQLVTSLSHAQATRLTMAPSSSFSAAVNTNALRFNRVKSHHHQQQQQKALWYNNFKMGNYRKTRIFVREKFKGMAKKKIFVSSRGDFFQDLSVKAENKCTSRIMNIVGRTKKASAKTEGERTSLKTKNASFAQIQKVDQINKLEKIIYFDLREVCRLTGFKTSFQFIAVYLDLWFWLEEVSKVTRVSVRELHCMHHSSGRKIFPKVKVLLCFLKPAGSSSCPIVVKKYQQLFIF